MTASREVSQPKAFRKTVRDSSCLPVTGPGWLSAVRRAAFDRFSQKGFPTREWESWRYMNLQPLLESSFKVPEETDADLLAPSFRGLGEGTQHRVFLNGAPVPALSGDLQASEGLEFLPLLEGLQKYGGEQRVMEASLDKEENPFELLNRAFFTGGAWVRAAKDTSHEPLHLWFLQGPHAVVMPRVRIHVEAGARLTVVIHSEEAEASAPSLLNLSLEVSLGHDASLEMVQAHRGSEKSFVFSTLRVSQEAGSRFVQAVYHRGGNLARTDARVELQGAGAFAELNGLGLLTGASQLYQEVVVHHRVPHTASRQFYKSILAGTAQSEFNSLSHVHSGAVKSEANQLNRNLLLSETARAYSRPKLKIYTDDVSASHGSANGQTQQQELFYLQSRGLDQKTARFVLTYGFAEEVLEKISDPGVRAALEADSRRMLEGVFDAAFAEGLC